MSLVSRIVSVLVVLVVLAVWLPTSAAYAVSPTPQSAASLYSSLIAKLRSQKGISMKFTATGAGSTVKGTALLQGNAFRIQMADGTCLWCDGKNLWTYNPRTRETTLSAPSAQEMAEVNPVIAIAQQPALFRAELIKAADGASVLKLLPSRGKTAVGLSSLWVRMRWDAMPQVVKAQMADGSQISVKIESFAQAKASAADFRYQKEKYKGVQVLDIR